MPAKHKGNNSPKPQKHSINKEKVTLPEKSYTIFLPVIGIILFTFLVYFKSLKNGYTNYDDDVLILNNSLIHSLSAANLKSIFTSFLNGMYHPLVTLSWAVEYFFFGIKALHYHLFNLQLHLLNIWLVYRFVMLLSNKIKIALIVTLFFAVHPLLSESVLWLSERKDLLCTVFMLSGLICYLKYLRSELKLRYFIFTLIFFLLSLFSKPSAIIFPLLLLVIDFYKARKIDKKVILEKLPFFFFSISFGIIAIAAASSVEGINTLSNYNFFDRIIFIPYTAIFYIFKLIVPLSLSAKHFYPVKDGSFLPLTYYFATVLFVALIIFLIKLKAHRKEMFSGMLFYIFSLAVVLPFVPVGDSIVSERYAYLPCIGLFLIPAYLYDYYNDKIIVRTIKLRSLLHVIFFLFLVAFSISTWGRIAVWHDSLSLWTDVISKEATATLAWTARGDAKAGADNVEGAIADYSTAINMDPGSFVAFNNRGYAWLREKEYKKAEADFDRSISINPSFSKAYYNRSCLWIESGEYQKAIADCNKSLKIIPDFAYAYYNRGNANYSLNNFQLAITDLDHAISLNDHTDVFYYYRGLSFFGLKNFASAKKDFDKVLSLSPDYEKALYYRSKCNNGLKDYNAAISDLDKLIAEKPGNVENIYRRGDCKLSAKNYNGAVDDFTKAISLDSAFAPAWYGRAMANISGGYQDNVCDDLKKAKKLGLGIVDDEMLGKYYK